MPKSKCTIGLLVKASQSAYRVKKDNIIDPTYNESYSQILIDMAEHGYAITDSIAPIGGQGTGTTSLASVCLVPQDSKSPIVISFRGTKTGNDVLSDMRLGTLGVVDKDFRDAAFAFYQKVRLEYMDRELVLTGHSLGGHLAQYVATKAYNTDSNLVDNPLVQVRTFNSAPINTSHSAVLNEHPELLSNFVNYRLSADIVSDLPLQQYYGSTFVFPCDKGILASHPMEAVTSSLPQEILSQTVGNSSPVEKQKENLIELLQGMVNSYQCRVDGQFFSRYRAGVSNLAEFQKVLPTLISSIESGDYNKAQLTISELNSALDGTVSKTMVNVFSKKFDEFHVSLRNEQVNTPNSEWKENQQNFKSAMKNFRKQDKVDLTTDVSSELSEALSPRQ